jgi:hypothetical protein
MASGLGTAILDFGAGSNEASAVVSDQSSISATSDTAVFVMGDDTTVDHSASDHRYFNALVGLCCGTPSAGTGFTIYAASPYKLSGTYAVRWVWTD